MPSGGVASQPRSLSASVAEAIEARNADSCSSEPAGRLASFASAARWRRSPLPAGASGTTRPKSHGSVRRWVSSRSSIGRLASARSSRSAGETTALWKPVRRLFQTPARRAASSMSGSSVFSAWTVAASGMTAAQVSSYGSRTTAAPSTANGVSGPSTVSDRVAHLPSVATATWNVWERSAGCSAGGVRRTTPASRSSTIASGPAVRSQLALNDDRSPAPARSQLSIRSCIVALPNRCRVKWSITPAKKISSPSEAASCLRMLEPLA